VDAACASIGRFAAPAFEVAYMATAIGLVRAGLGATLLPSTAADLRAASDLVIRDLAHPRVERELGVVQQKRRVLAPAAEAFVGVLQEVAAKYSPVAAGTAQRQRGLARVTAPP